MEDNFIDRLKLVMGGEKTKPFAARCNVSDGSIRHYLDGGNPGLDSLLKIAAACGVRVGWLAAGELPKELKREVLEDEDSLDLIATVGRIMEEKGLDQLQAFEDYKTRWDHNARKILKLPVREKVASITATPATHPALVMLESWLDYLHKTDQYKWAKILDELEVALPEFNEWLEKKRPGGNYHATEQAQDRIKNNG